MRTLRLGIVLICTLFLLFLGSDLLISTASEQGSGTLYLDEARLKPTPRPPRTLRVRRTTPPNALMGLSAAGGAGGGDIGPCFEREQFGQAVTTVYGMDWGTEVPSGSVIRIAPQQMNSAMPITSLYTGLCSPPPLQEEQVMLVSPSGARMAPLIYPTWMGNYNILLPVEAYGEPGIWRLAVGSPHSYEINIEILHSTRPFYLYQLLYEEGQTDVRRLVVGGFGSLENVKGLVFPIWGELAFDFDLQMDESGYALFDIELPDDAYSFCFIGKSGRGSPCALEYLEGSRPLPEQAELIELLYNAYWGGSGSTYLSPTLAQTRPRNASEADQIPSLWEGLSYVDLSSPGMQTYNRTIRPGRWRWTFTWCAKDTATLEQILQPLSLTFYIDFSEADMSLFLPYSISGGCRAWSTFLDGWQSDTQVTLDIIYYLSETIYDGWNSYPPGDYIQRINVYTE